MIHRNGPTYKLAVLTDTGGRVLLADNRQGQAVPIGVKLDGNGQGVDLAAALVRAFGERFPRAALSLYLTTFHSAKKSAGGAETPGFIVDWYKVAGLDLEALAQKHERYKVHSHLSTATPVWLHWRIWAARDPIIPAFCCACQSERVDYVGIGQR